MNKEATALVENTFTSLQGAEVDIASTDPIPVPQDNGYAWLPGMQPNPKRNPKPNPKRNPTRNPKRNPTPNPTPKPNPTLTQP